MKKPPSGWPRISVSVFYNDPAKAIDWLCQAFGFEIQLKVEGEDGSIAHSELIMDGGLIMVGGVGEKSSHPTWTWRKSPRDVGGGNTQCMFIHVDEVDAHCERARAAGAEIVNEPKTTDYGEDYWSDRSYACVDLEGHHWWFSQRMRTKNEPQTT